MQRAWFSGPRSNGIYNLFLSFTAAASCLIQETRAASFNQSERTCQLLSQPGAKQYFGSLDFPALSAG